jgi:hypothetical protein
MSCRVRTRSRAAAAVLVLFASLAGCGGESRQHAITIASVGSTAIREAEVAHWVGVAGASGSLGVVQARAGEPPRQRALRYLISTQWLLGEVAARGAAISGDSVEQALRRQEAVALGGSSEFRHGLAAMDMTVADARLEISRELAALALARTARRAATPSRAELLAYYRAHSKRFRVPEERDVDLVEHIPSRAAASHLTSRLAGAASSSPLWSYHETQGRPPGFDTRSEKGALVRAIFRAVPGRLYGPMSLSHQYAVFVVRAVRPASRRPLAQAEASIRRDVSAVRRTQLAGAFYASYRSRWTARTSCSPRFVVQGCRQYRGLAVPEANPFADE